MALNVKSCPRGMLSELSDHVVVVLNVLGDGGCGKINSTMVDFCTMSSPSVHTNFCWRWVWLGWYFKQVVELTKYVHVVL